MLTNAEWGWIHSTELIIQFGSLLDDSTRGLQIPLGVNSAVKHHQLHSILLLLKQNSKCASFTRAINKKEKINNLTRKRNYNHRVQQSVSEMSSIIISDPLLMWCTHQPLQVGAHKQMGCREWTISLETTFLQTHPALPWVCSKGRSPALLISLSELQGV